MESRERLIVALDDPDQVFLQAKRIAPRVGMVKVGKRAVLRYGGESIASGLRNFGGKMFLDFKDLEIPSQTAGCAVDAAERGAAMLTLSAFGGIPMMRTAVAALRELAATQGRCFGRRPIVLGATVLSSTSYGDLRHLGMALRFRDVYPGSTDPGIGERIEFEYGEVRRVVVRLAQDAHAAGCDGAVVPVPFVPAVRQALGPEFVVVSAGIRDADATVLSDDQVWVGTMEQALRFGADYLVVGRPITARDDLEAACAEWIERIDRAEQSLTVVSSFEDTRPMHD